MKGLFGAGNYFAENISKVTFNVIRNYRVLVDRNRATITTNTVRQTKDIHNYHHNSLTST